MSKIKSNKGTSSPALQISVLLDFWEKYEICTHCVQKPYNQVNYRTLFRLKILGASRLLRLNELNDSQAIFEQFIESINTLRDQ